MVINLADAIGGNYKEFWDFKGRYRVVKGGRGSKKSTTTAMWLIYHLLKHRNANALCVRRVYNTLRDSCYAELKRAARRLGVLDRFRWKISPLEVEVKGSGNKILFRGFDNPDSITSITVDVGSLCWVWVEEAYQVDDEESFNKLDMSIRGAEIEQGGLFPQITLTLNPWSEMWIKTRFFDKKSDDILAITRNYYHNEFLAEADYKLFHQMREEDPERYRVEGEGDWGIPGGRYFPEWQTRYHIYDDIEIQPHWRRYVAFDYGLDMLACYWIAVERNDRLYVYKELCQSNLVITDAIARIKEINNGEEVYQWVAPPDMWNRRQETGKSIADWFAEYGIPLTKASNNRIQGWLNMKEYLKVAPDEQGILSPMLRVSRACPELIRCIPRLTIDEKNPNDVATEPHDITHAPDAIRYFLAARPLSRRIPEKPQQYQFEFERSRASAINRERSVTPI